MEPGAGSLEPGVRSQQTADSLRLKHPVLELKIKKYLLRKFTRDFWIWTPDSRLQTPDFTLPASTSKILALAFCR